MNAVAYMMDTSKWSDFAGNISGAYAIGGPTVEMFVLSYNAKHDTKLGTYGVAAGDITSTNADEYGYKAKIGEGKWTSSVGQMDHEADNMWVKTDGRKASRFWVASPACGGNYRLRVVNVTGWLGSVVINEQIYGFRPVVSIPKSINRKLLERTKK